MFSELANNEAVFKNDFSLDSKPVSVICLKKTPAQ